MTTELSVARRAAAVAGGRRFGHPVAVPLAEALGRVLAEPLRARCAVPAFPASAMDGWAVDGPGPWRLGDPLPIGAPPPADPLPAGTARPIATGAAVPPGPVAVLRAERGRVAGGLLTAPDGHPQLGADVRPAGEEIAAGEVVLPVGAVLTPPAVALAAACGVDEVRVRPRPTVDLVLTGGEVDPAGVPAPGRVRDVYGPQLPGLLAALGCAIGAARRTADDPELLEAAVAGPRAQLVITTGGTGRGPTDHLRTVLDRLGCTLPVDGVGIRPGHPTLLAVRPDGTPVLCLPGNPFAAFAALLAVGGPLIDALCGRTSRPPGEERAGEPFPNEAAAVRLIAVRRTADGVTPVERQGPAMLTGLVHADGLALVPPGGVRTGAPVATLAFPW